MVGIAAFLTVALQTQTIPRCDYREAIDQIKMFLTNMAALEPATSQKEKVLQLDSMF